MTGSYFRTGLDLLFVSTMFPRHPFCAFVGLNLIWPMDCLRGFDWVGGAPPVETNSPIGRLRTNTCEAESWSFEHNIISPHSDRRLPLLIVVLGVTACFMETKQQIFCRNVCFSLESSHSCCMNPIRVQRVGQAEETYAHKVWGLIQV